jgi:FixJ family two-component response regulator
MAWQRSPSRRPTSVKAIKAGAIDFLAKPADATSLLAMLRRPAGQRDSAEPEGRKSLDERFSSLTPREREVLPRFVAGRLNRQIAAELGIVEKTIKVQRGKKMDVRTVPDSFASWVLDKLDLEGRRPTLNLRPTTAACRAALQVVDGSFLNRRRDCRR